jgi:hypothetical protein
LWASPKGQASHDWANDDSARFANCYEGGKSMNKDKRSLKVNLEDLAAAFDSGFDEVWHYLDLETGEVVMVTGDTRQQLGELLEATDAETIEAVNETIQKEELADWEKDVLYTAALVEKGDGSRFVEIPKVDSWEGHEDMAAFIETVSDRHVRELLQAAIEGKGAFRRFKDVLAKSPQERERWFQFRDARMNERALDWLDGEGIQPLGGDNTGRVDI